MRWPSRRRRNGSEGLKVGPGAVIPISPRDGRERVLWALSGVSMELAALPWDWNPERTPRPSKLFRRQQYRLNELTAQRLAAKRLLVSPFVKPGELIYVDGDPRDFDPTDLVHPTLLGKPRA